MSKRAEQAKAELNAARQTLRAEKHLWDAKPESRRTAASAADLRAAAQAYGRVAKDVAALANARRQRRTLRNPLLGLEGDELVAAMRWADVAADVLRRPPVEARELLTDLVDAGHSVAVAYVLQREWRTLPDGHKAALGALWGEVEEQYSPQPEIDAWTALRDEAVDGEIEAAAALREAPAAQPDANAAVFERAIRGLS